MAEGPAGSAGDGDHGADPRGEALRRDYADALALVRCASELCPRSAPSERLERAVAALLGRAGVEDTAAAMRSAVVDLSRSTDYVVCLANVWRKMQKSGLGHTELQHELSAAGIDWREQDRQREELAASLCPGWSSVRFREMLLGCGIGDSFGAGVEFWDGRWIHSNVDGRAFVLRRGDPVLNFYYSGSDLEADGCGAGQNFLPGMYTDDCEMTLGLIHALMGKAESPDDLVRIWKEEYFKGQSHYLLARLWALAGIGRNGHGGIAAVFSGALPLESMRSRIAASSCPGNAPPMRALPLAFLSDDASLLRLASANADATHPHVKARAASLGIALAGRYFVLQRRPAREIIAAVAAELGKHLGAASGAGAVVDEDTLAYLRSIDELPAPGPLDSAYEDFVSDATLEALCGPQPVWRGPAGDAPDDKPRMVRGLNADAMRTLGCVLYLLKHHEPGRAMATLLRSLYLGGDVDSLAALCLAMVGGREGLGLGTEGGIPQYMLQHLEAVEYIVDTADAFERWVASEHGKQPLSAE